jgi:hypothetical protein
MQAADIHTSARAFSLIVASWASTIGNSTAKHERRRCGSTDAPRTRRRAAAAAMRRASRSNRELRGMKWTLADREGNAGTGLGIAQPSTHNVTPEEDYRTAVLSDSPHEGVRYAGGGGMGERPGREAGLRYSAGRAPRGCGRSLHRCLLVRRLVGHGRETRDCRPAGRRSRGTSPSPT